MNISSAVRQQRDPTIGDIDDFPTPPWATRALFEHVIPKIGLTLRLRWRIARAWEPCANRGYMVKPLREYVDHVTGSDLFDYGAGFTVADFLDPEAVPASIRLCDRDLIVVANPPFKRAVSFIHRAERLPRWAGTAMFVRNAFTEGQDRYRRLYCNNPPTALAHFAERVVLHQGILRDPDLYYIDPETGQRKKPSTATSYCWMVWVPGADRLPPLWIPPCRKALTRPGDYPEVAP